MLDEESTSRAFVIHLGSNKRPNEAYGPFLAFFEMGGFAPQAPRDLPDSSDYEAITWPSLAR